MYQSPNMTVREVCDELRAMCVPCGDAQIRSDIRAGCYPWGVARSCGRFFISRAKFESWKEDFYPEFRHAN